MTLPGETDAVPTSRFALEISRQGVMTGRFIYGRSYLARPNAVEIDPVESKLSSRAYETVLMRGMFGALRDARPDYWGRLRSTLGRPFGVHLCKLDRAMRG